MLRIKKFLVFEGPGTPLNVKIKKEVLHKFFFHELTQL